MPVANHGYCYQRCEHNGYTAEWNISKCTLGMRGEWTGLILGILFFLNRANLMNTSSCFSGISQVVNNGSYAQMNMLNFMIVGWVFKWWCTVYRTYKYSKTCLKRNLKGPEHFSAKARFPFNQGTLHIKIKPGHARI